MKRIKVTTQKEWERLTREQQESGLVDIYSTERIYLHDSSRATLYHSSRATLLDSSQATLHDSSRATLHDSSRATLHDSSQATLYHSSQATLYHSSQATLHHSSQATLHDSSRATLLDSSQATLHDSSQATLYYSSQATLYHSSRATLLDSSRAKAFLTAVIYHYSAKDIKAYDNTTVYEVREGVNFSHCDETVNVIKNSKLVKPTFEQWLERGIVYADGIYQELVSKKTIGDVTIYKTVEGYVAQKGDKFAHADTAEKAKEDLRYKFADRDKSEYESWDVDAKYPTDEMIECYRVLTGACSGGTRGFCESVDLKVEYSPKEVIEMTKGKWGHEEFAEFWR